jgi:peptidyl-prolyl cis-trans isomerase C
MNRAFLLALLLTLPASALADSPKDRVYARFGDVKVTVADIEAALALQAPAIRKRYRDPEKLKEFADQLVRVELFAWEARRQNLHQEFRIRHERDRNAVQLFLREAIDEKLEAQPVTDEDIAAYYEENKNLFESPASVRAAHLLVADQERAAQLVKEVEGMSVRDFRELARKESLDERTKLSGGDLRFIDEEGNAVGQRDVKVHAAIAKAAFTLNKPGEVYPEPVEVDGNYSVIVLRSRREPRVTGVEGARERIRNTLQQNRRKEALEALVNRLYREQKPELTDDLLSKIDVPAKAAPEALGHGH